MILFLVIIALFQVIFNLVFSSRSTTLSCGLAGFYPKKGKKVNLHNLFMLGIMNEERGTDSTGLSIGREKFNGLNTTKKCRDFIINNSDNITKLDLFNQPCILHTRKSTVGAHNEANCHPFVVTNSSDPDYHFVLAHNGVINNTYAIKNKFLLNIPGVEKFLNIDSHYMTLSLNLAFRGECDEKEVLEFYEGNAALLYYDNKSTFKAWKGGCNNVEERPLFYIETTEGWYFCSIESSLKFVFRNKYKVIQLKNNELLTFHNHKLESSQIFERKKTVYTNHINAKHIYDCEYNWENYYSNKKNYEKSTKVVQKVVHSDFNSPLYHPIVNLIDCSYVDRHNHNKINGNYKACLFIHI